MGRRFFGTGLGLAAALAATALGAVAAKADPIRVISHRQPALEYYTSQMKAALPDGEVSVELMPIDKELELASITMSSGSDAIDVAYMNDGALQALRRERLARAAGRPLGEVQGRVQARRLPQSVMQAVSYDGHIYSMPILTNTELFFYRKDLFDEKGIEAAADDGGVSEDARRSNSGRMAGTIMSLKPVDAALNEAHWYMNAIGDGWFDENWKPIFNNEAGVKAITKL